MDYFIRQNIPIPLTLFIHTHSKLSICQVHQGFIPLNSIFQALQEAYSPSSSLGFTSSPLVGLSQLEINVYTSLIIDACALQLLGPEKFIMPKEIVANDEEFLKNLLAILYLKTKDQTSPAMEEFKVEIGNYLRLKLPTDAKWQFRSNNNITINDKRELTTLLPSQTSHQFNDFHNQYFHTPTLNQKKYQITSVSHLPRQQTNQIYLPTNTSQSLHQSCQNNNNPQFKSNQYHSFVANNSNQKVYDHREHDMNNPMIRFLAYIRKAGFDLIVPQGIYDKILAIIYETVLAKSVSCLRDLIDLTMVIKDSNVLSQIDQVSKTKIRGVLALLKQSNILVTEILDEGNAVRLVWTKEVQSFGDFRDIHDKYVVQFLSDNKITMPLSMKAEIIWMFEEQAKKERLLIIDTFITKTAEFLSTYEYKQTKNIGPKTLLPMKSDNSDLVSNFRLFNPFCAIQDDLDRLNSNYNISHLEKDTLSPEILSTDSHQDIPGFNLLNIDFDS